MEKKSNNNIDCQVMRMDKMVMATWIPDKSNSRGKFSERSPKSLCLGPDHIGDGNCDRWQWSWRNDDGADHVASVSSIGAVGQFAQENSIKVPFNLGGT